MTTTTRFQLENVNPLRGLDIPKLVTLIENGERGYYARLQWLFRAVEKRDPIVRAVKKRLLSALAGLDWDIKIVQDADDKDAAAAIASDPAAAQIAADKSALAEKQASTLRAAYDKISNLRDALNFLALAELRGFSHLEKIYQTYDSEDPEAFEVVELRIVEQWFFCRDGFYGAWNYNPDAAERNTGDAIDLGNFVIHTVDDPVDEIFAELAIKRRVSDADWDGFLEDFGIPPLFIGMPPNVPKEKEAEYQRTAELAVSAARGSLPSGASLLTPSATGSGGAGIFRERLSYIDEQIVIAGTSGKLTVLAESGSGNLAGGAQKEAFDEIAQAIADQISGVMQKQFDLPLLARVYPDQPVLAYFEFAAVNEEDVSEHADNAVKFGQAGYAIDDAELSEKTGYTLRYVGPQAAHTNRPDGTKEIGIPGSTAKTNALPAPAAEPGAAAPIVPAKTDAVSSVGIVADALSVAPQFVAPGQSIIDDLLLRAADDAVGVDELTAAAENLLQTLPELAAQTDLGSIVDALSLAMQTAAETTLGGGS